MIQRSAAGRGLGTPVAPPPLPRRARMGRGGQAVPPRRLHAPLLWRRAAGGGWRARPLLHPCCRWQTHARHTGPLPPAPRIAPAPQVWPHVGARGADVGGAEGAPHDGDGRSGSQGDRRGGRAAAALGAAVMIACSRLDAALRRVAAPRPPAARAHARSCMRAAPAIQLGRARARSRCSGVGACRVRPCCLPPPGAAAACRKGTRAPAHI